MRCRCLRKLNFKKICCFVLVFFLWFAKSWSCFILNTLIMIMSLSQLIQSWLQHYWMRRKCQLTSRCGLISSKVFVMVASSAKGAMATTRSIMDSLGWRRGGFAEDSEWTELVNAVTINHMVSVLERQLYLVNSFVSVLQSFSMAFSRNVHTICGGQAASQKRRMKHWRLGLWYHLLSGEEFRGVALWF